MTLFPYTNISICLSTVHIITQNTPVAQEDGLNSETAVQTSITNSSNKTQERYFPQNNGQWDKTGHVNLTKLYHETIRNRERVFQGCGSNWQELYKVFHDKSLQSWKSGRYLIYSCKGKGYGCAGYGNRIGGIASLFFLAVLTNRVFLIDWKEPESLALERFLQPNKIQWNYDLSEIESLPSATHYWGKGYPKNLQPENIIKPSNDYGAFARWFQTVNFDNYFNKPVERITATWSFGHEMWSNPYLASKADKLGVVRPVISYSLVGCVFNFLFKTTKELQSKINQARTIIFPSVSPPVIGLHIRMGDAVFGRRRPLNVQNFKTFFKCAQLVESSIAESSKKHVPDQIKWFLATDDVSIKQYAIQQFPGKILTLDLKPQHIGIFHKVRFPSYEGMMGVLLDHFLLADCFFLILSSSTFGKTSLGLTYHAAQSFTFGDNCGHVDAKVKHSPVP